MRLRVQLPSLTTFTKQDTMRIFSAVGQSMQLNAMLLKYGLQVLSWKKMNCVDMIM